MSGKTPPLYGVPIRPGFILSPIDLRIAQPWRGDDTETNLRFTALPYCALCGNEITKDLERAKTLRATEGPHLLNCKGFGKGVCWQVSRVYFVEPNRVLLNEYSMSRREEFKTILSSCAAGVSV